MATNKTMNIGDKTNTTVDVKVNGGTVQSDKLILLNNVSYGESLPTSGVEGQLFFVKVSEPS